MRSPPVCRPAWVKWIIRSQFPRLPLLLIASLCWGVIHLISYWRQGLIDTNTLGSLDGYGLLVRDNFKALRVVISGLMFGYSAYMILMEFPVYLAQKIWHLVRSWHFKRSRREMS